VRTVSFASSCITASSNPCSRNHINRRCNSLGMVTNHRRAGFSSGVLASTTTTIKTFLCTSIPATFIASSWRGSGRTHAKKITHRHVLPSLLLAGGRDTDWFRTRSQSNSKTASLHPACKQTSAVHAPSAYTHRLNLIFMSMGGPRAHRNSLTVPGRPVLNECNGLWLFSTETHCGARNIGCYTNAAARLRVNGRCLSFMPLISSHMHCISVMKSRMAYSCGRIYAARTMIFSGFTSRRTMP
jgi:hypothetical protein